MRFWLPFARSLCSLVRRLRQIGRRRAEARGEGQIRQYRDRRVIVATAVHGGLTTISRSPTHCPTRVEVSDGRRTRHPFYGRGRFHGACLATRRRVPILSKWGRRVELAIVQEDTTLHGVIDSSLKLNDDSSFHHLIQLTVTQQYHSCLYVKSIIMVSVGQSSIHTMTRTSSLWATGSLTMYNESFRVLRISRNLRNFTSLYLMYLSPFIHPLFQLIRDNTLDRLSLL